MKLENERTKQPVESDGYDARADITACFEECYRAIRERVANGGPGWEPKPC